MTTDEDLCREWQEGSSAALELLVQRYHTPIFTYLMRMVDDMHTAQDVTQETFLRLVRESHTYQYPRPFRPWLFTIARHLTSHIHHSAYKRRVTIGEIVPDLKDDNAPDPTEWLERLERKSHISAALSILTLEQREVLSLRFDQQLSVSEVATILCIPEGTVKSRTHAALRQLQKSDLLQQYRSRMEAQ